MAKLSSEGNWGVISLRINIIIPFKSIAHSILPP